MQEITSARLGLDAHTSGALKNLVKREQEAATKAIIESCGGAYGFEKKQEELRTNWNAVMEEWRRQREIVRRVMDSEYLAILTWDQLAKINEHLRNAEIRLENNYGPNEVHYLIGGVGKPPR
ncbi:MAG: hypothetical protein HY716_08775 [Planctomycetes bacterium]|nr:hypothetical protein [Planctomycetota bacterium]